ncbi:MAG: NAD(P)/FAD-dependent oxidoreductase [Vulcanimicrobiaceae bacterium]
MTGGDEVLVVGGGPAGSATALLLARAGVQVRVLERARFPRRKVCGEYLNAGAVAALERLGLLDAVRSVGSPLRGVRLVVAAAQPVALPFPRPALSCARELLDALLLDAAAAAGAAVERARVEEIVTEGGRCVGLQVRDEDGLLRERRARIVVGADGAGSVVARRLGLARPLRRGARYAVGGHYAGFGSLEGCVEMYVGDGAYFALNPLDASAANVMVVVPRARLARWAADLDAGVGAAATALARGARSFAGTTRLGARVSVGPLAHDVRAAAAPGALLVGDAAGFLDPFTGQGVALALQDAERAAETALASLRARRGEAQAFAAYARDRRDDRRWRRRLCRLVAVLVDVPPLARRASRRLARSPELGATLLDGLAGTTSPRRALRPGVLARLLA